MRPSYARAPFGAGWLGGLLGLRGGADWGLVRARAALGHDTGDEELFGQRWLLVLADDVQVQLEALAGGPVAAVDPLVDRLHALEVLLGDAVRFQRAHRRHLAAHQRLDDGRQGADQLPAGAGVEFAEPRVAAVGAWEQLR